MAETPTAAPSQPGDPERPAASIGPARLATLVEQAFAILADRWRADPDNIERLLTALKTGDDPDLIDLYEETWRELVALADRESIGNQRKSAMERIIVRRFDHLLARPGEAARPGETLSRRVIAGTTAIMEQMLGEEVFRDYSNRFRALVEDKQAALGPDFSWDAIYRDEAADVLVNDLLVYIARYFQDIPKRRDWAIGVFSRVMPPPSVPGEEEWRFGFSEFHLLTGALYATLNAALRDPERTIALNRRYGPENLQRVRHMLDGLSADRRALEEAQRGSGES